MKDYLSDLKLAGQIGLDGSPGDALCQWAAEEIEALRAIKVSQEKYAYALLGKTILVQTKERVASGQMGEEDEEIMKLAEQLGAGNVRKVSYDPQKHGSLDFEPGDPIWWWGEDLKA